MKVCNEPSCGGYDIRFEMNCMENCVKGIEQGEVANRDINTPLRKQHYYRLFFVESNILNTPF